MKSGGFLMSSGLFSRVVVGLLLLLQVLLLVYAGSLQAYNICGMVTAGG